MSCSSAARSPIPGAPSAGIRSGCSRPTGRAGCPASAMTATIPTASAPCPRSSPSSPRYARGDRRAGRDPHHRHVGQRPTATATASRPTAATGAAGTVVLASGACNIATRPDGRRGGAAGIATLTPMEYRNPGQLAEGGVLVVGASATGIQLAEEIHRSGRPVTLSVGEHVRAPRTYRGRDIQWWMDRPACSTSATTRSTTSCGRARCPRSSSSARPSREDARPQRAHARIGVKLRGRLAGIGDGKAQFSGSLRNQCALADLKMNRLLDTHRRLGDATAGSTARSTPPHRFPADRGRRVAAARHGPRERRDQDDPLGDRLPPGLFLARPAGASTARARSSTTAASSRRRRECT